MCDLKFKATFLDNCQFHTLTFKTFISYVLNTLSYTYLDIKDTFIYIYICILFVHYNVQTYNILLVELWSKNYIFNVPDKNGKFDTVSTLQNYE